MNHTVSEEMAQDGISGNPQMEFKITTEEHTGGPHHIITIRGLHPSDVTGTGNSDRAKEIVTTRFRTFRRLAAEAIRNATY